MFSIIVTRARSTPSGTPGVLKTSGGFTCDTLELQWADNQSGISCIMPDTYQAVLWWSPTLNRLVVRLEDKHGRKDCLIHNGNWAGEASGEITQIHGCTEVGQGYGMVQRPDGKMQFGIKGSSQTLAALITHIQENVSAIPFSVTYVWGDGFAPPSQPQ